MLFATPLLTALTADMAAHYSFATPRYAKAFARNPLMA